jgi:predicted protein tyrosine phosphatase
MEDKHHAQLVANFGRCLEHKVIHVLDIPDEYRYMDPELVGQLKIAVAEALGVEWNLDPERD